MSVVKAWTMLHGHLSQIGSITNIEWMHQQNLKDNSGKEAWKEQGYVVGYIVLCRDSFSGRLDAVVCH